jgi:photoactive yellow protein
LGAGAPRDGAGAAGVSGLAARSKTVRGNIMEKFEYNGVDLAELLPRIPEDQRNALPFGLVKMDTQGTILEYNMAEGELTGVDPKWAIGKNFFDEVAICTKTATFYGRFVEGINKGFLNTVFDYTFDHRSVGVRVKVHMVMMPDHLGRKNVLLMVKRMDKPVVLEAIKPYTGEASPAVAAALAQLASEPPAACIDLNRACGHYQPLRRCGSSATLPMANFSQSPACAIFCRRGLKPAR